MTGSIVAAWQCPQAVFPVAEIIGAPAINLVRAVIVAEPLARVRVVVPVGRSFRERCNETAAPRGLRWIGRRASQQVEDGRSVAHLDFMFRCPETRSQCAVRLEMFFNETAVIEIARLVSTQVHAAESGVVFNPPKIRMMLEQVVARTEENAPLSNG